MLGKGVTTYIVSPTTRGAASCPFTAPVEKDHASFRFATLPVLI